MKRTIIPLLLIPVFWMTVPAPSLFAQHNGFGVDHLGEEEKTSIAQILTETKDDLPAFRKFETASSAD